MHGGYFSDPETAKTFIEELSSAALKTMPKTVADLGGGTGFILSALSRKKAFRGVRLVNVDVSKKQLEQSCGPGLECLACPAEELTRDKLLPPGEKGPLMLAMRSLLHYFGGKREQEAFLKKARSLVRRGEYFVHQSACFNREEDAALMNKAYRLMSVSKTYLTVDGLAAMLGDYGWKVEKTIPAPALDFTSAEMVRRYGLSPRDITVIRASAVDDGSVLRTRTGFAGRLEYSIFVCRAA